MIETLKKYIKLITEQKAPSEARISNGKTVAFGSDAHIIDLENRIESLNSWRNASKRGTDRRANYSRLISQLRAELRSARRYSEKLKLQL